MPPGMEENPGSFLATISPIEQDLDLSTSDQGAAQAVAEGLRDAKAANTRRVYGSAWHKFHVWALESGRQSLPADPRAVALYLGHLAADGKAIATIALARAAAGIAKGGYPARHPVVAEMVKGWRNQAPAPRQAGALTAEALTRIRETSRLPGRGRGGRIWKRRPGPGPA